MARLQPLAGITSVPTCFPEGDQSVGFIGTHSEQADSSMPPSRRQLLTAAIASGASVWLAGCSDLTDDDDVTPVSMWMDGETADVVLEIEPATDKDIAAELARSMTSVEKDIATELLIADSVYRSSDGSAVRTDTPFVLGELVFEFEAREAGTDAGYRAIVALIPGEQADVERSAVEDDLISFGDLPTLDRERIFYPNDWTTGGFDVEVRTGTTYLESEAASSVIVPEPAIAGVEWEHAWALIELPTLTSISMTQYEYTLDTHPISATELGAAYRDEFGIDFDDLNPDEAAIFEEALASDGGYTLVDDEAPPGLDSLVVRLTENEPLPPFFHVEPGTQEDPGGVYIVERGRDRYLVRLMIDGREGGYAVP